MSKEKNGSGATKWEDNTASPLNSPFFPSSAAGILASANISMEDAAAASSPSGLLPLPPAVGAAPNGNASAAYYGSQLWQAAALRNQLNQLHLISQIASMSPFLGMMGPVAPAPPPMPLPMVLSMTQAQQQHQHQAHQAAAAAAAAAALSSSASPTSLLAGNNYLSQLMQHLQQQQQQQQPQRLPLPSSISSSPTSPTTSSETKLPRAAPHSLSDADSHRAREQHITGLVKEHRTSTTGTIKSNNNGGGGNGLKSPHNGNASPSPAMSANREKVFTCKLCQRSFGYKHVLQNHERTHTGEKPFECKVCQKRFTRDHHLKTHMRLHTGEKPYACTHCDRQFVQVANLRRHLRVHTGEKPYKCEECDSRFSDSNQLKAHLLIHSDKKPFSCSRCGCQFRRHHHLANHVCHGHGELLSAASSPDEKALLSSKPSSLLLDLIELESEKRAHSNSHSRVRKARDPKRWATAPHQDLPGDYEPVDGVKAEPMQAEPEDLSPVKEEQVTHS